MADKIREYPADTIAFAEKMGYTWPSRPERAFGAVFQSSIRDYNAESEALAAKVQAVREHAAATLQVPEPAAKAASGRDECSGFLTEKQKKHKDVKEKEQQAAANAGKKRAREEAVVVEADDAPPARKRSAPLKQAACNGAATGAGSRAEGTDDLSEEESSSSESEGDEGEPEEAVASAAAEVGTAAIKPKTRLNTPKLERERMFRMLLAARHCTAMTEESRKADPFANIAFKHIHDVGDVKDTDAYFSKVRNAMVVLYDYLHEGSWKWDVARMRNLYRNAKQDYGRVEKALLNTGNRPMSEEKLPRAYRDRGVLWGLYEQLFSVGARTATSAAPLVSAFPSPGGNALLDALRSRVKLSAAAKAALTIAAALTSAHSGSDSDSSCTPASSGQSGSGKKKFAYHGMVALLVEHWQKEFAARLLRESEDKEARAEREDQRRRHKTVRLHLLVEEMKAQREFDRETRAREAAERMLLLRALLGDRLGTAAGSTQLTPVVGL